MKSLVKRRLLQLAHYFGSRPALKRITLRALSRFPRLNTWILSRLAKLRVAEVRPVVLDRWGQQIHERLIFRTHVPPQDKGTR